MSRSRIWIAAVGLGPAIALLPSVGLAELPNPPSTVTIGQASSGPVETQGIAGYGDGGIAAAADSTSKKVGSGGRASGSYTGTGYTYELIQNNVLNQQTPAQFDAQGALIKPPQLPMQQACPSGQIGYYVYDPTGVPLGVVCVPAPSPGGPAPITPVITLAQQATSLVPWPNLIVSANPTSGLSGLASWFWVGGSAVVPPASATAGPLTVTVRATLVDAIWDFGDGTAPLDSGSSLGKAYPTPSDVAHVYQASSYSAASGFTLTLTLRFSVSYSVNGGPSTPFGTATRTYSRSYPVLQAQPEGVSE